MKAGIIKVAGKSPASGDFNEPVAAAIANPGMSA